MSDQTLTAPEFEAVTPDIEVAVVGAGFGGLYMLHRLRQAGLSARAFEAAPDVGGVWFWNRYPGARCDAESLAYSYSFDAELQQNWKWPERFSAQPDILRYAQHVADRFDLRRDIVFNTRVTAAIWNERQRLWIIRTDDGGELSARYFISAAGGLSASRVPDFPGLESFQGEWYHTGQWPHHPVSFAGKRVAVVGTGSSGVQSIPVIAQDAAQLYVLQRTPSYSVPARNGPMDPEYEREIKDIYQRYRAYTRDFGLGFIPTNPNNGTDLTEAEREAEFRFRWESGGPLFMLSFRDTMTNADTNEAGARFIRARIGELVKDPQMADLLSPKDYPNGAKRICVDTDYYETFNRKNVSLVDISNDAIRRITPSGIELESGRVVEVDLIVYATGYDALTGALLRIDIRGRDGLPLAEKWSAGPLNYLGIATSQFPNFFFLNGPCSPAGVGNVIAELEQHGGWLAELLAKAAGEKITSIEAEPEHEKLWVAHVNEMADATLFPRANSWYLGANIPGKPRVFMPYVGGSPRFREACEQVRERGYESFTLR